MADKSWLSRLGYGRKSEVQELKEKLEATIGEMHDSMTYEVKFFDDDGYSANSGGSGSFAGIEQQLDAAALQRIYASEIWVYAAVTEIAKTVSSLPQKLEKSKKVMKQVRNEVTGSMESVEQLVWIDASGEKLFRRFEKPNKWTTKTEWLWLLVVDLLTTGEFFIYLDSDEDLATLDVEDIDDEEDGPWARLQRAMTTDLPIKGMYRVPPTMIKPIPSANRQYVEGYAMQSDKGVYAFNFAEIIHVKLPNPLDPFSGLSPLVAAAKPVLMDRFSTEHMIRFYKTGARLGGVIQTDRSLTKDQLGRFQRSFEANFTGRKNHHRTLILPPGMQYETIEQNPAETALLDFCKYNREAILSAYHVPPIKVGIMDGANYANARVQLQIFFTDTIKPILSFIEDGYNLKNSLMPQNNAYRLKFDLSDVEALKEDLGALAEAGMKMSKAGLTVNEIRAKVWKAQPIAGGDKAYSVAEIDKLENGGAGALIDNSRLAAPEPGVVKADDLQDEISLPKDLSGPQTTAIMNIIARVAREKLTKEAAVELMIATFSLPRELACRLVNLEYAPPAQASAPKPCDTCKKDPCECPPTDKGGGKRKLGEFIDEQLAQLDSTESVTPEFLSELVTLFYASNPDEKFSAPEKRYASGHSKAEIVSMWKGLIDKTEPLIAKREAAVVGWFKSLRPVIMNKIGANLKAYGMHKARDKDDADEILDEKDLQSLIAEYIKQIDTALDEAYKLGHNDTLVNFEFQPRNEVALEFLKKYGASEVKHIMDTTRDQLREVLEKAFDEGAPVNEVALRIQEKFTEMETGRAKTIARTETLTAVSAGRQAKREEFQKQFPDAKLKKMWISAQDDKVRDSHQDVDGEVVDADADFSNGLAYPREEGGPPEEVINCRCTDITFAEEDAASVAAALPTVDDDSEKSLKYGTAGHSGGAREGAGRKPGAHVAVSAPRIERTETVNDYNDRVDMMAKTQPYFDQLKEQSPELAKAVHDWSDNDYVAMRAIQRGTIDELDINDSLRARAETNVRAITENFDKLPEFKGPLVRDLVINDITVAGIKSQFKVGGTFKTEAMSSFTANEAYRSTASVRLIVSENKSGRAIWGMSRLGHEAEVLVPKDVKYKITKIEYPTPISPAIIYLSEAASKTADEFNKFINDLLDQPPSDRAR